jgi:siderophore synthetase component
VLQVTLPHSRTRLLVAVAAPSATGNFSYSSAFYAKADGKPWAILDWEALAATLLRELGQETGIGHNEELMQQMRDSVGVTASVLALADPAPFSAQPAAAFIASEQSLLFGHPFHPAPKSRQGVSHQDMLRYSPETGARFPLHYFAVQREYLMQRSLLEQGCDEIVAAQASAGLAPDDGHALLPVHPWQASHLLAHPLVTAALEQGRLRYLGPQGDDYFPTSSIRTLYHPDQQYFYKCSLNIRITNCVRKNAHYELEGALQVSEIMRGLMPDLKQRFSGLEVLEEPAFMSVDLKSGDAAGDRDVSEAFGSGNRLRRYGDGRTLVLALCRGADVSGAVLLLRAWLDLRAAFAECAGGCGGWPAVPGFPARLRRRKTDPRTLQCGRSGGRQRSGARGALVQRGPRVEPHRILPVREQLLRGDRPARGQRRLAAQALVGSGAAPCGTLPAAARR